MKFSILISSFNKGKYIEKCITSCLQQKEKDYEIIVFDNYSTDNTLKILKKFGKKIRLFKKKKIKQFSSIKSNRFVKKCFSKI